MTALSRGGEIENLLPRGAGGAAIAAPDEGQRIEMRGAEQAAPLPLTLASLDLSRRER
jgi:hypothetical protein